MPLLDPPARKLLHVHMMTGRERPGIVFGRPNVLREPCSGRSRVGNPPRLSWKEELR